MLRLTGFFIILFTPAVFFMSSFFSVFFSTEYQIGSLSYVDNFGKKDTNAVLLLQPNKAPLTLESGDSLVSIPLLGDGYYRYQKIGQEIQHYSRQGEELWRKEYPYYPVSDYYGKLILLLAGDSSQVFLMDRNGFLLREEGVYGMFLSDYDFSTKRSRAALVFSSGETYLIGEDGRIIFHRNLHGKKKNFFLKSCALSPDGRFLAVHFLEDEKDFIAVLKETEEKKAELINKWTLSKPYPHLLHIAVNLYGVLAAAPDRTIFFSLQGEENWEKKLPCAESLAVIENCPIYRPVFAGENFFLAGSLSSWMLIDKKGQTVFETPVSEKIGKQWRFLPTKEKGIFGIHSGERLEYYRYRDNDS